MCLISLRVSSAGSPADDKLVKPILHPKSLCEYQTPPISFMQGREECVNWFFMGLQSVLILGFRWAGSRHHEAVIANGIKTVIWSQDDQLRACLRLLVIAKYADMDGQQAPTRACLASGCSRLRRFQWQSHGTDPSRKIPTSACQSNAMN